MMESDGLVTLLVFVSIQTKLYFEISESELQSLVHSVLTSRILYARHQTSLHTLCAVFHLVL